MLSGNLVGLLLFVAAASVVAIGYFILKLPDEVTMISAGLTLVVIDLVVRFFKRPLTGWLTKKEYGGFLLVAPAWVFGAIVIVVNVVSYLTRK